MISLKLLLLIPFASAFGITLLWLSAAERQLTHPKGRRAVASACAGVSGDLRLSRSGRSTTKCVTSRLPTRKNGGNDEYRSSSVGLAGAPIGEPMRVPVKISGIAAGNNHVHGDAQAFRRRAPNWQASKTCNASCNEASDGTCAVLRLQPLLRAAANRGSGPLLTSNLVQRASRSERAFVRGGRRRAWHKQPCPGTHCAISHGSQSTQH